MLPPRAYLIDPRWHTTTRYVMGQKAEFTTFWMEPVSSVCQKILDSGGWPTGYPFLSSEHTVERDRPCMFTTGRHQNEYWTTFLVEDDYLWWKLSEGRKAQIRGEIIQGFKLKIAGLG